MICASPILDSSGSPFETRVHDKRAAAIAANSVEPRSARGREREIRATYDAASNSTEFRNYWGNADALDADSANNKGVRQILVQRSRYEVGNNGFADGMVQTLATDTVGIGPRLRMKTNSPGFNVAVETAFNKWAKKVLLRRKLWCMYHAKVQDGESFAMLRNNPKVKHPVKLDLILIETERCQSFALPYGVKGYIDGIKFDEFGNPQWYDILPYHPGGLFSEYYVLVQSMQPEQVDAKFILQWFMLRRPGQHRGVPEFRSTLNTGAASRRWREATIASAETAADYSVFFHTNFQPDAMDPVSPMATMPIQKRMATALPMGWDATQMDSKHPNATYEMFHDAQVCEQARPKSMPKNKAKCDSSDYNYASGRLDNLTYFGGIDDVEREDCDDLVLDPLFEMWWQEAVLVYGWNSDPDEPGDHGWDWPNHPTADVKSEAAANDSKLRNGSTSLSRLYAENGEDFEAELPVMAADYFGDASPESIAKTREVLRNAIFNNQNQQASLLAAETAAKQKAGQPAVEKFDAQVD